MIQELQETLTSIQPAFYVHPFIQEMLVTLSQAPFAKKYEKAGFFQNQDDFQLNENNIEYFLGINTFLYSCKGELEELLNMFFEARFNLTEPMNAYVAVPEENQNIHQKEKSKNINALLLEEANQNASNQELLDKNRFLEFAIEVHFLIQVCEKKKNVAPLQNQVKKNK